MAMAPGGELHLQQRGTCLQTLHSRIVLPLGRCHMHGSSSSRRARHVRAQALPLSDVHQHLASIYDLADAATAATAASAQAAAKSGGWLAPLTDTLEGVLKHLQDGLDKLHVPYSYGFSIILLTAIVKTVTLPLTKKQVESQMAVQMLKPRIDMIKARYGEDKDKVQTETSLLYKQAGVNPAAGCLPSLATIPIFIGLYRSLSNVADEGLLEEGFFWIPSLAGPTTLAARQSGSGTEWLYPFVDGAPPIGWHDALCYVVLPVLLVVAQWVSSSIISPIDPNAENANQQKLLIAGLPLMVGWFALCVPSGLALYYFSNTVFTSAQQIWMRKLGGATVTMNDLGPVTKPGTGRRLGPVATDAEVWTPPAALASAAAGAAALGQGEAPAAEAAQQQQQPSAAATALEQVGSSSGPVYYAKRKKLVRAQA